jgi:hypothetical protein
MPTMTPIRRRFTGAWALLRQPDALLAGCRALG